MIESKNLILQESTPEEIIIYQHLRDCVSRQSPRETIEEFKLLLIEGREEQELQVCDAWSKIILQKQEIFNYIFNRCFYIIINHWLADRHLRKYIPTLVDSVKIPSRNSRAFSRTKRSLFKLIAQFVDTEQYFILQRLVTIASRSQQSEFEESNIIGDLLTRYPWLFRPYLKLIDPFPEIQESLKKLQKYHQNQYEVKLAQYFIYRARLVQLTRNRLLARGADKLIKKADNPTLLDKITLKIALKQFLGKVENRYNLWQQSQHFLAEHRLSANYKIFKTNLVEYLLASFKPEQQKILQTLLGEKILKLIPESNSQPLDELLLRRTCSQLLNYLFAEDKAAVNYSIFNELVNHLGVVPANILSLKIILLCPELKSNLEKKWAILYSRYESLTWSEIPWLVQSLEILQIGFSLYFGNIDLSIATTM